MVRENKADKSAWRLQNAPIRSRADLQVQIGGGSFGVATGRSPTVNQKDETRDMSKTKRATEFRPNDFVVYPAHGVGRIVSIDEQEVAGLRLEMFVISFEKDKMTLRVPIAKASSVGMRPLSSADIVERALETLKGRARVKRAMWSRRAQEYEQKINSGDLISIAEVVRDLHRNDDQREQSYSERQLYEAALERLTREVAAVNGIEELKAQQAVDQVLDGRVAA